MCDKIYHFLENGVSRAHFFSAPAELILPSSSTTSMAAGRVGGARSCSEHTLWPRSRVLEQLIINPIGVSELSKHWHPSAKFIMRIAHAFFHFSFSYSRIWMAQSVRSLARLDPQHSIEGRGFKSTQKEPLASCSSASWANPPSLIPCSLHIGASLNCM